MDGRGHAEVNVDANTRQWNLDPCTEYRFELDPGTTLAIKVCLSSRPYAIRIVHWDVRRRVCSCSLSPQLIYGHAEIFGAELAEGATYLFGLECKAAVYTWQGCVIEISTRVYLLILLHAHTLTPFVVHTSQASLLPSMSPTKPPCKHTPTCTSRSSRCAYARCARCTDRHLPLTMRVAQTQIRIRPEYSSLGRQTRGRRQCRRYSSTMPCARARSGHLCLSTPTQAR